MGSGIKKDTMKSSSLECSSLILADELHKPVIKKFNKIKVYSQFKDNIWGVDLYSKYAFVIPLKDKKGISITNGFNKIIKQFKRKPNKTWVDQGSEFYNRVF